MSSTLHIHTTDKFESKAARYLTLSKAHEMLREGKFTIYSETSPYNPEMYDDNNFILRCYGRDVDIIVKVLSKHEVLLITQRGYHGNDYESEFYANHGSGVETLLSLYD